MLIDFTYSQPTPLERNWAMLAHLSALLTIVVGVSTGGVGVLVTLLLPLGIYLYFSGRSRYVSYHALQATVFQALGAVVFVAMVAVTAAVLTVMWVGVGVLSLVLVGLLLLPVAIGITLVAGLELVALPAIWLAYTLRGAYQAYNSQPFDYPGVGPLVGRTLAGTGASVPPAPPAPAI
jgi:uncharacterized Tic20 family protein